MISLDSNSLIERVANGEITPEEAVSELTKSASVQGLVQPLAYVNNDTDDEDEEEDIPDYMKRKRLRSRGVEPESPLKRAFSRSDADSAYRPECLEGRVVIDNFDFSLADKLYKYFESYARAHRIKNLKPNIGDGSRGVYLYIFDKDSSDVYYLRTLNNHHSEWTVELFYDTVVKGIADPSMIIKSFLDKVHTV